MAKKQRNGFIFYRSFLDAADGLEGVIRAKFIEDIINYALDGKEPDFKGDKVSKALFSAVRPNIEKGRRNFENGNNGGAPKGNTNALKSSSSEIKNNRETTGKQPRNNAIYDNNESYNSNNSIEQEQNNESSINQSAREGGLMEDEGRRIEEVGTEALNDLIRYLCHISECSISGDAMVRLFYQYENEISANGICFCLQMNGVGFTPEKVEEIAAKFWKMRDRRLRKGLTAFAEDWKKEIATVFNLLEIDKSRIREYYDTDCKHSEDDAIRWISENVYNDRKTYQDLKTQLLAISRQKLVDQYKAIPNNEVSEIDFINYCAGMGFTIDAREKWQRKPDTFTKHWTKWLDACETNEKGNTNEIHG